MMFPYPVGRGAARRQPLRVHRERHLRTIPAAAGHNVFEPLGYDAFGIHSENYALKVGVHPMELIPRNIANFRRQLERAGLMVDWRYELSTDRSALLQVDAVGLPAAARSAAWRTRRRRR